MSKNTTCSLNCDQSQLRVLEKLDAALILLKKKEQISRHSVIYRQKHPTPKVAIINIVKKQF